MQKLLNGIKRFQQNIFPKFESHFQSLATRQNPEALLITCSDSRIVPEMLTQSGPGDLFVYRNAGNIIPPYRADEGSGTLATIEYAVSVLRVKSLIICGHSDCGAMKGVLHPDSVRQLPLVDRWLKQAECARRIVHENHSHASEHEQLRLLIQQNVIVQLESVKTHPSVAAAMARGELQLHGLYYDIGTGDVSGYNLKPGQFLPLNGSVPSINPGIRSIRQKRAA